LSKTTFFSYINLQKNTFFTFEKSYKITARFPCFQSYSKNISKNTSKNTNFEVQNFYFPIWQFKLKIMSSKQKIIAILLLGIAAFAFLSLTNKNQGEANEPYVVMLSMDGFRWDYASRVRTPNLDKLAENGVKAEYVIPAFPSKTFPNHYSMATGLYPDNHGIVNNNFYCPELDMVYRIGDRQMVENTAFYGGEPIWVTAEKQGLTTASYFWVGSEAPVKGIQPTYWKRYEHSFPFENRIDTVIKWLNLPEKERPRLITFYFHEPDGTGHNPGPNTPELDQMVIRVDSLVGVLVKRLSELPIANQINLIVTSDHGMTEVSTERYVDLGRHVRREWLERWQGGNPLFSLKPVEGKLDYVYNILKSVKNIKVWKANEIPARLNYGKNPRVLDLIVLADSTWSVGWGRPNERYYSGGAHGWDNAQKDMHTIFYATGPAFKKGHLHTPMEVVDLYPLIAKILNLEPAEVDGKLERVMGMLE
jgi:alkaline phosphatase D